jgi:tight adherence protein C
LGLGLWSIVAAMPRLSRPRLAARIAPYLVDVSEQARREAGRATLQPLPLIAGLLGPATASPSEWASRLLGGREAVASRLRQAGSKSTVERFRARQLLWAAAGLAAGLCFDLAGAAFRTLPVIALVVAPPLGAVLGFACCDRLLVRAAARRRATIAAEFPTVVEFLALSLSAGEGLVDAIRRVSRVGAGELPREFAATIAEINTGVPIASALESLSRGLRIPAVTRFVDAAVGSLERGAPLVAVLKAQAADARQESKRRLLESAGKKEVAMLVPLVFLILPTTILFAIFPGIVVLQSGF